MAIAIIGLVGAALGALITLFGGVLTEGRRARRDEVTWRRDKRAEAYDGALRHLLRAANLRSEFLGGTGGAVLKTEHQREFFDDLVQAQFWLHTASRYCSGPELDALRQVTEVLDIHVVRLVSGVRFDEKDFSIWQVLQICIRAISDTGSTRGNMQDAASAIADHSQIEIIDAPGLPGVQIGMGGSQINMFDPTASVRTAEGEGAPAAAKAGDRHRWIEIQEIDPDGPDMPNDLLHVVSEAASVGDPDNSGTVLISRNDQETSANSEN